MNQEERNKVYEGFTMIDVMAKNIIREAEGLVKYQAGFKILTQKVFHESMNKIIKTAKAMEHRKQTYFTWLERMKDDNPKISPIRIK